MAWHKNENTCKAFQQNDQSPIYCIYGIWGVSIYVHWQTLEGDSLCEDHCSMPVAIGTFVS